MSVIIAEVASPPPTPANGKLEIFADTVGIVKAIDKAGRVYGLADESGTANMLTNGEFDYAQRQAPGTLTTYSQTAARGYTADRWAVTNENASIQYIRTDTATTPQAGLLARFFGTYSKITTTGKIEVSQVVEAGNCLHLRGKTIRVQGKMKSSTAKTMRIVLLQLTNAGTVDVIPGYAAGVPSGTFISAHGANSVDPTFGANLAKISPVLTDNCTIVSNGLNCSVTTAWQRFGATFVLPTDFKNLIVVVFTDSQFAAADSFSISEWGLYDGPQIREWTPRKQALQLLDCARTYQKSFPVDSAPIQNFTIAAGGHEKTFVSIAGAVAAAHGGIAFAVGMRVSPAIVLFNPAAANAFVRNVTAATDATASSATGITADGFDLTCTGLAAWSVAQSLAIHYTADAEI